MASRRDPLRSQPFTPTTIQDSSRKHESSKNQYPANSRIPRRVNDDPPSPFPAHPSVRVPPGVRIQSRGMPMGVGVAPRPSRAAPPTYAQDKAARQPASHTANTSRSTKDSSRDSVSHISHAMHTPPPVPPSASSSSRRYNMTQSYVSSLHEDSPEVPQAMPVRESHYPEDDLSPRAAYPSSRLMPQFEFPTPNNRATMDTVDSYEQFERKPKPKHINSALRPSTANKPGEISPASTRAHAMNALSQAIAIGISQPSTKPVSPISEHRPQSPTVRMPFDDDMSTHTKDEDLEPPELKDAPPVPRSRLATSPTSSESPILGLGIGAPGRGLSTKRDAAKRPPRIDMDAVRDMEARGSTTSLTDLIKRATKLASNLDRGKTASRLGMLDMFRTGSSDRLANLAPGKRDSSMSDMLSAFPAPAIGTPRSEWPINEKGSAHPHFAKSETSSESSLRRKAARRRICGLTVPCFTVVIIILILLVAAAVLIPIFLIVVPRHNKSSAATTAATLSSCARSDTTRCANSGISILTSTDCGCICANNFLGPTCSIQGDATCTTRDIKDGNTIYRDATMSQSVLAGFTDAGSFNIPLNATTILGAFSSNSVSCADQGSLVDVSESLDNATTRSTTQTSRTGNAKRAALPNPLVMLPGFEPPPLPVQPHVTSIPLAANAKLQARQATTGIFTSENGIVFDTARQSATSLPPSSSTPTTTRTASSATSTATGSAAGGGGGGAAAAGDVSRQLSFARVVVLYMLDRSGSLAVALDAKARLGRFFESVGSGNEVVLGEVAGLDVRVDMLGLVVRDAGRVVGS